MSATLQDSLQSLRFVASYAVSFSTSQLGPLEAEAKAKAETKEKIWLSLSLSLSLWNPVLVPRFKISRDTHLSLKSAPFGYRLSLTLW